MALAVKTLGRALYKLQYAACRGHIALATFENRFSASAASVSLRLYSSGMVKARKYILNRRFDGFPKDEDFKLIEEELPPLKDGEFVCEAEYFSVDPYIRPYSERAELGTTVMGSQVAKVTASKNQEYPVGSHVVGYFGWRSHTLYSPNDKSLNSGLVGVTKLPDIGNLSRSLALGVLGMPGVTAYIGFLDLCQPKPGEVVVVSTAAGAVGSVVGQIAKLKGCKVIGYTGTDEKVEWLKSLGFDHAYNYKKVDLKKSLKEAAPNGVDCYFDNVGGEFTTTVVSNMRLFGRIAVCGASSEYNEKKGEPLKGTINTRQLLVSQLRIEAFIVSRWADRFPETIKELAKLVNQGKIKYEETVFNGFESLPQAFFGLFTGENMGKMIIKV